MGKCNIAGATIDWVMRTQGVSFRHAVELVRADHPALAAGSAHVVRKGTTAKLPSPITLDADDQQTIPAEDPVLPARKGITKAASTQVAESAPEVAPEPQPARVGIRQRIVARIRIPVPALRVGQTSPSVLRVRTREPPLRPREVFLSRTAGRDHRLDGGNRCGRGARGVIAPRDSLLA